MSAALPRVARVHPPVGLSTLFRPLPKQARPVLDVEYRLPDGLVLRFSARQALGIPEQTLLLVLLEMAGEQFASVGVQAVVQATDTRPVPQRLWTGLYPQGTGEHQSVMMDTTWEELNRRCGSDNGGSAIRMRKECLRRLCEVVVWEEQQRRCVTQQSFLVSWLVGDDRRIHLALNHRLAAVFVGGQYARVSLAERMQLRTDLAMHIHAFFSTSIRPGHQLHIGMGTLAARVWPLDHDSAPDGTRRRRRTELRRALEALGRLRGWKVTHDNEDGMATVYRQGSQGVREMPSGGSPSSPTAQGERSTLDKSLSERHLSQYDVSGLFNT